MTTSPQPESPEPLKVVATTPHEWIWEFLNGSAGYMGVFFGEKHPNHQGRYWWRHFLHQEVEAMRKNLSDAEAAIQAARNEAEAMRAALQLAVDHIDMSALRISHCKDAAAITAAINGDAHAD